MQAIKTAADIQNALTHLHKLGIPVPFAVYSTQDLHNPGLMIAQVDASGLGLPDRDYYLKPDKRFVEARDHLSCARSKDVRTGGPVACGRRSIRSNGVPSSKSAWPKHRWTTWRYVIPCSRTT